MNDESSDLSAAPGPRASAGEEDLHGRGRMVRNILTNWGAQAVQMISGFIVPRLIDRQMSQEALGVWDFAWSIVVYFGLVQMGVTGSINRYVAFHRAQGDFAAINRAVSSVAMVMRAMAGVVMILAVSMAWLLGPLFAHRLGPHLFEARCLVFLLGTGMAVQISAAVYASVLTGCHRWDWHNGIHAGTSFLLLGGMVGALLLGYGLTGLAVVTLVSESAGRSLRAIVAYRLCPWLEVRRRHFHAQTAREMMSFGGKTFLTYLSNLLMHSSVNILVAAHLGPAALALYARPMALVRSMSTFVNKYAMVFSPTISSFHGAGEHDKVRALALSATRYGLFLSLPATLFLVFFGGEVLHVWMGSRYVAPLLIGVLVAGSFMQVAYIPLFKALVGLNRHGTPGLFNVIASATALGAAALNLLVFETGLVGVALGVGIPMTIVNGIVLPWYACRVLKVSAGSFFREVWRTPILCALPLAGCLAFGRWYSHHSMKIAFLVTGCGILALAISYWKVALPSRLKHRLAFIRG